MRILNKILIALDALLRGIFFKPKKNLNNKRVLIVFQQALGDTIVIIDSLKEYSKIFPKNKGYEVVFIARKSVIELLKAITDVPEDFIFEAVDFRKFIEDFKYYKEISNRYRGKFEVLIAPASSPSAEIFSCSNDAGRKIASVRAIDLKYPLFLAVISKYAYTEKVRPDKNEMTLQRHRQLINYLAASMGFENYNFKARLPELKSENKIIQDEHYCVVCAGASKPERWWPADRFSEVIDFINEEFNLNVHLCGGPDEIEIEKKLKVKHPEMLISHVGKTNFHEWSSIVQHSDLVVANDSSTAHLAAAHKVKTVCIIGDYEFVIFPYKVDILEKNQRLPLCVFKRFKCEGCRDIGYYSGSGNPECLERLKNNKCTLCIDAISVQDVKNAILKIMKD